MQQPLALNSPLSIAIGNRYSMQTENGVTSYFLYLDAMISTAANNSVNRSLLSLIEELITTLTQFPDTDLTLFYELAPVA